MFKRMIKPWSIITYVLLICVSFAFFVCLFLISNDESYYRLPLQDLPAVRLCKKLRKISEPRNPVGLVAAPGCGTKWLRFLLQQATGTFQVLLFYLLSIRRNENDHFESTSMIQLR